MQFDGGSVFNVNYYGGNQNFFVPINEDSRRDFRGQFRCAALTMKSCADVLLRHAAAGSVVW